MTTLPWLLVLVPVVVLLAAAVRELSRALTRSRHDFGRTRQLRGR